jgi:hypothetical protein
LRDHFFKYTDIETAQAILENQSFRYSSPLSFNDPFDIQSYLIPEFDLDDFPREVMAVIEQYVTNDYEIPNPEYGFSEAILLIREKSKSQGYKKSEIEQITYPLLGYLLGEVKHLISQVNSQWKKSMLESRVFCVTEEKDNLLMWAHYAKDHTGAVFQLATLPEADTPLSVAKEVRYKDRPVQFYSLEELIKWTLFDIAPDYAKLQYSNHAYRKATAWGYENEWRVVDMCQHPNKTDLYVDHRFIPAQLQKIFFGCKACDTKISLLIDLAKGINPKVELYKARKHSFEYALDFEKI